MTFAFGTRIFVADGRAAERQELRVPAGARHSAPVLSPTGTRAFFITTPGPRLCPTTPSPATTPHCGGRMRAGRTDWGWGPGGTFVSLDRRSRTRLCITSGDGVCQKTVIRLRGGRRFSGPAALSPDGRTFAAAVAGAGAVRITLFDARTGRLRREITTGHRDQRPAWSPDGRAVAFLRDATASRAAICRVSRKGDGVTCPVARSRRIGAPSWGR